MTCGSCGAEIADKAIVCYRCGAPTAVPAPARAAERRAPVRRRGPRWTTIVLLFIAAIVAAVQAVRMPAESWRTVAVVIAVVAAMAGAWLLTTRMRR